MPRSPVQSKPAPAAKEAALKRRRDAFIAKHAEMDKAARELCGARRSVETVRGIEQIVVCTPTSILRWPTAYERGEAPCAAVSAP